jgi:segregation and condensation protein A
LSDVIGLARRGTPGTLTGLSRDEPVVLIGEGRAPERTTVIRLEGFDGPLALLLAVIESRQLDVLTVPLGALAGAYLDALAGIAVERLSNVSAFIAVASQLILIKSRALLPRPPVPALNATGEEAPDPEAELRARLVIYRAHRDAGRRLAEEAAGRPLFRREPTVALAAARAGAQARPVALFEASILGGALAALVRIAPPPVVPPEVVRRTIRMSDRVAIIRAALEQAAREGADSIVLQELLADVSDRVVKAVTFLAMLEMVKRREITIEQAEPWGPIVARRVDASDGRPVAVAAADEFDAAWKDRPA